MTAASCPFCGAARPSEGGGVHIPSLPPHVLKAMRLLEELAAAGRISTVEWETVASAISRRAPRTARGAGFVIPAWSLDGDVGAPVILAEAQP